MNPTTSHPIELTPVPGKPAIERHEGIELFRSICCFFVICIHFAPPSPTGSVFREYWGIACAAAVPFFFAVSGYFQGVARNEEDVRIAKRLKNLALIWIGWLPVGILMNVLFGKGILLLQSDGLPGLAYYLFIEGGYIHLWFIPALFFTIIWTSVAVPRIGENATLLLAAVLYALGISDSGQYPGWRISLPGNPRDFIWSSSLPFICGHWLAGRTSFLRLWHGLLAILGAVILLQFRSAHFGKPSNYVEPIFLLGVGLFIISLRTHPPKQLTLRSGHTLGIYCLHGFLCFPLYPLLFADPTRQYPFFLIPPLLMYLTCFAICRLASKTPLRRWFA